MQREVEAAERWECRTEVLLGDQRDGNGQGRLGL